MDQPPFGTSLDEVRNVLTPADTPAGGNFFGSLTPATVDAQSAVRETQRAPLLSTDTGMFELSEDGTMEAQWKKGEEFESANRGGPLTTSDQSGVMPLKYPSDLLAQDLGADEVVPIAETFAKSGSTRPNQTGGILAGDANNVMAGSRTTPPENIGNPRVGAVQQLGVIPGGSTPAESEQALRKQILEAIRTEPSTRLDQTVAIPELYNQVNPVAKLAFPIMQTRPQFQEDFTRGRLSLPSSLTIDPSKAYQAQTDAYSHIGSLDHMKSVYASDYGGKPPAAPGAFSKNTPMKAGASAGKPLPSFADMYPGVFDATNPMNRGAAPGRNPAPPNALVPDAEPDTMAPLMYGGKTETVPSSFSGGAPGSNATQWPVGGTGYAVDGKAMRTRDFTDVPTTISEAGAGNYTSSSGQMEFPYAGSGGAVSSALGLA